MPGLWAVQTLVPSYPGSVRHGFTLMAVGLILDQSLVGHFPQMLATIPQHILLIGQIVGRRFYGQDGVPVRPLEVLPNYRRGLVQAILFLCV